MKTDKVVKKIFQALGCPKEMKLKTEIIKGDRKSFKLTHEQWVSLFGEPKQDKNDKS